MNQARFEALFDQTVESIRHLLVVKGGEYAGSDDRLANFKRGAALTGVTPMQCLLVYMSKHYDAVSTYIRDEAAQKSRPRSEPIEGRIDDLINYCILLKALVREGGKVEYVEPSGMPEPADLGEFVRQTQNAGGFSSRARGRKVELRIEVVHENGLRGTQNRLLSMHEEVREFLRKEAECLPGQRLMFNDEKVLAWRFVGDAEWRSM